MRTIDKVKAKTFFWFLTFLTAPLVVVCVLIGWAQAGVLWLLSIEPEEEMFVTYAYAKSFLKWRNETFDNYVRSLKVQWFITSR